jgi:hypothetical protein
MDSRRKLLNLKPLPCRPSGRVHPINSTSSGEQSITCGRGRSTSFPSRITASTGTQDTISRVSSDPGSCSAEQGREGEYGHLQQTCRSIPSEVFSLQQNPHPLGMLS